MIPDAELRARLDALKPGQTKPRPAVRANLTDEEAAFAMAIDYWKRHHGRPFPTFSEVLQIARAMGYRKETTT